MFGLGILDAIKIGAGAALGALIAYGPAYLHGTSAGRQQAAIEALESAVEAYQARQEIDDEVGNSDLVDICVSLGGLRDQCTAELRGLDETAGGE